MLHIDLSSEQLPHARFALSPMTELSMALIAAIHRPLRSRLGSTTWHIIKEQRLEHLAVLCRGHFPRLPGFITSPPSSYDPGVEEQLHAIANTPAGQVRDELSSFFNGSGECTSPMSVRDEVMPHAQGTGDLSKSDERNFVRHLADDLACLWGHLLASRWPAVKGQLEVEVARSAMTIAREGWAAAFPTLHQALSWSDGCLTVDTPCHGRISRSRSLILVPSTHAHRPVLFTDDRRGHDASLAYPVGQPEAETATDEHPLGQILGRTRLALLASLGPARTTAELAKLHALTAGSVSYHLTRLHSAGLVHRQRRGRAVYYRRSPQANALMQGAAD
ncbi:ArsR/SmtB family transcription factor [Streptomyces tauricus]|uniref:ArsR/SmtB family transcription factor n=1 Tax=Streptomyces tauricus TaxID=68274 RepID=UPI0033B9B001